MVKNIRGSVLVIVMVYTLFLIILGITISGVAVCEHRMEIAHRNVVKAYYLAEAGMERIIYEITKMGRPLISNLKGNTWEMEEGDNGLIEPGVDARFVVGITDVDVINETFIGEGGDIELYKTIYSIKLKSTAVYRGAPAGLEAYISVEVYENTEEHNRVEVLRWRQVGGDIG